ncbi:hypothetical protein MSAN_01921400 [Mycena sanguinolenta]|uniref:Uncharacterized protein n=1 Tax=Mycena sanguinolenta TaxID=230812 RepID=A0A8H6XNQ7_9AGAR|nr:hypothetical protein MSAN_01921400 [Mycena sanguinolenta]
MCCVGNWNLSYASLTSHEALAGLRNLRTTNPTLARGPSGDGLSVLDGADEEAYSNLEKCKMAVMSPSISCPAISDPMGLPSNFPVSHDGGITQSGNVEASDAKDANEPADVASCAWAWPSARKLQPAVIRERFGRNIKFFM